NGLHAILVRDLLREPIRCSSAGRCVLTAADPSSHPSNDLARANIDSSWQTVCELRSWSYKNLKHTMTSRVRVSTPPLLGHACARSNSKLRKKPSVPETRIELLRSFKRLNMAKCG